MAKLKQEVWKERGWERGKQIPGGNQGHTFFARKSDDPPNAFNYVLKILKRQDNDDRRARFCAEVRAMDVLDHPGVVKVEDTNAECFREREELFLITHRIAGSDLEALVKVCAMALEDAVRMTIAVFRVLDHCHRRNVIHRDIKPCHVILPGDSPDHLVLIDFGLAYHRDSQPSDAETKVDEGRGNRFLIGPEHSPGNPDVNRTGVTDICQCVGLLFFAITQQYPRSLRDTNGKKPHDRFTDALLKLELEDWKRKRLLQIFDVGFEWEPIRRWQTIDRLVQRLEALLSDSEPTAVAFESDLESIVRRAETESPTARMARARVMAAELVEVVISDVVVARKQTEKYLDVNCSRSSHHGSTVAQCEISIRNKVDAMRSKAISFVVELSDIGQIDVSLRPFTGESSIFQGAQSVRIGSYDLGSAEFCESVRPAVQSLLTRCVAEVLGVDSDSEGLSDKVN